MRARDNRMFSFATFSCVLKFTCVVWAMTDLKQRLEKEKKKWKRQYEEKKTFAVGYAVLYGGTVILICDRCVQYIRNEAGARIIF